ncbi:MAG: hypothetical protein UY18_C0050G0004 [Microgenomates group bacterium GW2011_GWF2_47_9]|nr:MAG: hypothetical protein UY18_C0050G0004 [Microgenomates group bacterium GW2011_GWF2_47_9]
MAEQKTIVLKSPEALQSAIDHLIMLPTDQVYEVVIRVHERNRSGAQNSLLWVFYTAIGNQLGETKDAIHLRYKRQFLVPIYTRDDPGYAAMIEAVRKVHLMGHKEDAKALGDEIVRLTSTTTATVKQFAEYLTDIEHDAIDKQLRLPAKDEVYNLAMGVKNS